MGKRSPFAPLYSELYWYRPYLLKWGTLSFVVLSFIQGIFSWINHDSYTEISFIFCVWGLCCFILIYLKKSELATFCLLIGLSIIIFFRAAIIHSAMSASYLGLILIGAGILLHIRFCTLFFIMDSIYIIICIVQGIFDLDQPIDPETNLFYANTATVLIPIIIISYLTSIVISKVLLGAIQSQITHLKQLQESEDYLIAQEKMSSLRVLAGGIAHDFNNLLTSIIGNIQLIDLKKESIEENNTYIQEIGKAADRAKNLANQLLLFSKPSKPNKTFFKMNEIISEVVNFTLHGRKAKAEINCAYDVWPIYADKAQISQVIQNLIINADQAMPNGGIINVVVNNMKVESLYRKEVQPGNYVQISIIDHGIGIEPDHLKQLFEPFFTTKKEGSGLGLAISNSIISNHNGNILFDSEIGKGATFDIILPATVGEIPESDTIAIENRKFSGRVLVLDDELNIQLVLKSMLMKLGFDPTISSSGQETIQLYEKALKSSYRFDFVILDLTIPGEMGGYETLKQIQEIDPAVKAIVSSGYSDDPILENYQNYGFHAALPKPYTMDQLVQVISQIKKPDS